MWNMKCINTHVATGAIGLLTKVLNKYLEAIPGKHSIDSLQKKSLYLAQHT